jgi:hypothetical protein
MENYYAQLPTIWLHVLWITALTSMLATIMFEATR